MNIKMTFLNKIEDNEFILITKHHIVHFCFAGVNQYNNDILKHWSGDERSSEEGLFRSLTQVAGLAVQAVELLLIGPLLVVGGGDDEQTPSPTEPTITEHFNLELSGAAAAAGAHHRPVQFVH